MFRVIHLCSRHGVRSLLKFEELERSKFYNPLVLHAEDPKKEIKAYIDVDQKLNDTDKLSQVR